MIEKEMKTMQLPREVVIGPDALGSIPDVAKRLFLRDTAIVVCDGVTRDIAGTRVKDELADGGLDVDITLIEGANRGEVDRVKGLSSEAGATAIFGVGGGRPIDVAKVASFELDIPFVSIPTATSHDGIASARASVRENGEKCSIPAHPPMAIIGDTSIIVNAPSRLLRAGCGDIISNQTAVLDWELAHRIKGEYISGYATALADMSSRMLMDNLDVVVPVNEESARFLLKALVSSGVAMSIAGSSRPSSGAEHMFSHTLDRIAPEPALHGEQCGLGSIISMFLHGGDWETIKVSLETLEAPTTAADLGLDPEIILEALTTAHTVRPERYTILGDGIRREAAERVCTTTGIF